MKRLTGWSVHLIRHFNVSEVEEDEEAEEEEEEDDDDEEGEGGADDNTDDSDDDEYDEKEDEEEEENVDDEDEDEDEDDDNFENYEVLEKAFRKLEVVGEIGYSFINSSMHDFVSSSMHPSIAYTCALSIIACHPSHKLVLPLTLTSFIPFHSSTHSPFITSIHHIHPSYPSIHPSFINYPSSIHQVIHHFFGFDLFYGSPIHTHMPVIC